MRRRWAASSRSPGRSLAAGAGALLAGAALAVLGAWLSSRPAGAADAGALTPTERAAILALGPWPPAAVQDPANPASGRADGIALGETLFFSPRLSATGLRCASCHEPWRHFTDGRLVAQGVAAGSRNTPGLMDAARHRHYGWDGARDELWRQSLRPLDDAREMPASTAQVAALMRGDPALSARLAGVFGAPTGGHDDGDARLMREVGLALAAYIETLVTPRAPFDDWRDRLAALPGASEPATSAAFAPAARRGLRLFVGRGGCVACHAGPTLGDDAFHVSLVHSLTAAGAPDAGHRGEPANAFRTPGLRDVAATPPYLHDGSAATLCDAMQPHSADAGTVPPLLTAAQRRDLAAFLRTLSANATKDGASACGS
jgi:cytochrome c peroxidase